MADSHRRGRAARLLPDQITAGSYTAAFAAYFRSLSGVAPEVPLLGPALAEPRLNLDWVARLLAAPHPGLSAVTVHRYPFSACVAPGRWSYPVRANAINAAFSLGRHGLQARPLLYGMVMFNRMLGPDARLVSLRLRARRRLHLKAWAACSRPGILRVLVINKGPRAATVGLTLPTQGAATVQRLRAPSARATRGMTLAEQRLLQRRLAGRPPAAWGGGASFCLSSTISSRTTTGSPGDRHSSSTGPCRD